MASDLDHRLVELAECGGHLVEHGVEVRVDVGAVGGEGDAARHVEGDVVAHALDLDAGIGELRAQLALLLVLVVADRCAAEAADRSADGRIVELVTFAQQADDRADAGADGRSAAGLGGVRVAGARAAGKQQRSEREGGDLDAGRMSHGGISVREFRSGRAEVGEGGGRTSLSA